LKNKSVWILFLVVAVGTFANLTRFTQPAAAQSFCSKAGNGNAGNFSTISQDIVVFDENGSQIGTIPARNTVVYADGSRIHCGEQYLRKTDWGYVDEIWLIPA
jgi:hypothetical protein